MSTIIRFIKTNTLLLGFAVLVIPLFLLLWFQYVWLDRLEHASAIAQQVTLRNCLDVTAKEVTLFYRSKANQLLRIPQDLFVSEDVAKIAVHWKNADLEGIRRLYVVKYTQAATGNYFTYNPSKQTLEPSVASAESLAVIIACLPWQAWVRGAAAIQTDDFQVNEQDPEHRMMLNPIVNAERKIIAVVAMILDEDYLRKALLKTSTDRVLGNLFSNQETGQLFVTVRDKANKLVFGTVAEADSAPNASIKFPFVFRDWSLSLYTHGLSPQQWARKSFATNMALAILLTVVVLGGSALALRTASRAVILSEMKSDFVSNVSHELRTPLASIRVFAEFLRMGKVPTQQKVEEYGELIELETQRLSRLVDNILDFSRIESKRKIYSFTPTDLVVVVEAVLKSFSLRLKQSGFTVQKDMPQGPLPEVNADPDAIGQVLHNLIDNAVKYSADNKEISVRLYRDKSHCVISIRDRGIGISKEEQGRIFERFHRVSTKLIHDIKGSGLGLAIVFHIMRAHHGTVEVESEPGVGSTFYVRLPLNPDGDTNCCQLTGAS